MPIDPSVFNLANKPGQFGPDLKEVFTLQNLAQQMQASKMVMDQEQQGQNALKQVFSNPENFGADGVPTPNALRQIGQASPPTYLDMIPKIAQMQQRQSLERLREGKEYQAFDAAGKALQRKVVSIYDQVNATQGPEAAQKAAGEAWREGVDTEKSSGIHPAAWTDKLPMEPPPIEKLRQGAIADAAANVKPLTAYQGAELGFKAADEERKQSDERRKQAQFSRGALGTPENVEVTKPDGTKEQIAAYPDKDVGGFVTADGTRTPIEGKVRVLGKTGAGEPPSEESQDKIADAIAGYQQPPLTGYAMRSPSAAAIMAKVYEKNPDYQGARYPEVAKAMRDFGTGKQGDTTRSMNVGIDHLKSLDELVDALNTGKTSSINAVANYVKTHLGLSSAPTTFDAAKTVVSSEIIKAVQGSQGALGDREEVRKDLEARLAPGTLKDVMQEYRRLMGGQLKGLERQYEDATGFGPDSKYAYRKKLYPETVAELESARTPGAKLGTKDAQGRIRASPDEAEAIKQWEAAPSGTKFVDEQGNEHVEALMADEPRTSWEEVVKAWEKRGVSREVAEGIADNVRRESGFRPTVEGDSGTSAGLYQAHADRKSSLQAQKNWQDPEVQHDWALSQVTGGDRIATDHWDEIKGAKTREEARDLWKKYFERPAVTSSDKPGGRFASSGIEFEQGRNNTSVRYMDPLDYLDMLPPIGDDTEAGGKAKRRALMKSLNLGDEIEAIPTIELSGSGDRRKIADFDGRHRAQAAADADLTLIPVAFRGVTPGNEPKEIVARNGEAHPFSWAEVPKMIGVAAQELLGIKSAEAAEKPLERPPWLRQAGPAQAPPPTVQPAAPPPEKPLGERPPWLPPSPGPGQAPPAASAQPGFLERELGRAEEIATAPAYAAAGAARLPVGAAQLAAHGAEALGIPGASAAAGATDAAARGLEGFIGRGGGDAPYLAGAGDIAASAALPVGRLAQLPRLAQPLAQAGVGAAVGAAQPVTGGDYGEEKKGQVLGGLAAGGALGVIGQGLAAAGGLVNKIVTPADVTRAAGRLFGADTKELTPEIIKQQRNRISGTLETIERNTTVPVRPQDLIELNRVLSEASTLLPQEFAPIEKIVQATVGKAPQVRGDEMAALARQGTPLDMLTKRGDPNVAHYAYQIERTIRDMIADAMPPAQKDMYSAARSAWRDMQIVSDALKIGKTTLDPRRYAAQIAKRFPNEASIPNAAAPPVLKLGRAVGELYGRTNRGAELMPTVGGLGAFAAGHAAFGMLGGAAAYMAGHGAGAMARNRLIDMAIARSPNALQALQPRAGPIGNMLTGLGAPQIAPAGAAAATMP